MPRKSAARRDWDCYRKTNFLVRASDPASISALNIDMHEHRRVQGIDKTGIKMQIRTLKKERDELLGKNDPKRVTLVRTRIGRFKRKLRKTMV